jgi:type IV pilus assembly protein PilC
LDRDPKVKKVKSAEKSQSFLQKEINLGNLFKFKRKEIDPLKVSAVEIAEIYEEKKRRFWEIEIGRAVPQSVLLQVTRQLGAFTASGIPIVDAIDLLAETTKNKRMKSVLQEMSLGINQGLTLPAAAKLNTKVFPQYYIAILDAAERSGDLATAFETLAIYLERDLASSRAVKSALYYPIILVLLTITTVMVLSIVVLPRFAELFASLNTELPLPTRILMSFSNFVALNWKIILIGFVILIIAFMIFINQDKGRFLFDRAVLKIPIFGNVLKIVILERFSRVLGSLANSGVPLPDALELSASATGNKKFEKAVLQAKDGVLQGRGLVDPLEETRVFPAETIQMLRVGEQSGRLVYQLENAATYYAKEVDYKLKNITSLIEPVILILVGGGVGFVAIALVSAMYGIYSGTNINGV